MISENVQKALNEQVDMEAYSSRMYLAMASWSETQGWEGVSEFMYRHADEERMHMLKIMKYINERGGHGVVSNIERPPQSFGSLKEMFDMLYEHEMKVSAAINDRVHVALEERDYATHHFLQWFVGEQIEEEALARLILDKIEMIGNDQGGLYLFDRDIVQLESHVNAPDA